MKTNGIFCISLDTELWWGVHDSRTVKEYGANVLTGKKCIPKILEMFEEFNIKATWAIVGFLFAKNKTEVLQNMPSVDELPQYENEKRSSYRLLSEIGEDEDSAPLNFYPSLIDTIKERKQEIASHTFSHYYCAEAGQTIEQFKADLAAMNRIVARHGVELKSLVFPRNQSLSEYVKTLGDTGYVAFRGREENWIYNVKPVKLSRLLRFVDAYIPLSGSNTFIAENGNDCINIRGSRFFRPYNKKLFFMEFLKIARIKGQMKVAAKKGRSFHLWWHPHNFGGCPEKMLLQLREILEYYQKLNQKYGFVSMSMGDIAKAILKTRKKVSI